MAGRILRSGPAPRAPPPPGRGWRRASAARAGPDAAPSAGPSSGGLAPPSLPPRRGDSRSGRRRLRRPLPLLLLLAAARAERAPEQAAALRTRSPRRPRRLGRPRAAPSYFSPTAAFLLQLNIRLPRVNFQKQESLELGQGDEPRGSTREESGGDVHSAEGPRAAYAEEDGVKSDRQRGGVLAYLRGGSQQPAQPAATALHRPGCPGTHYVDQVQKTW